MRILLVGVREEEEEDLEVEDILGRLFCFVARVWLVV